MKKLPQGVIRTLYDDNWKRRRKVMFLALIYIAVVVLWIVVDGADTALNQQVAIALIAAGTAIIGSYVFGAVWDDNNKRTRIDSSNFEDLASERPSASGSTTE